MRQRTRTLRHRLRDTATEAMLDSAERVMIRKGYERATMQEIAGAAGCATGTFYLYFKSKEVLFEAIAARRAKVMFDEIREAMDSTQDPVERLRRTYAQVMRHARQQRAVFRMVFTAKPMRQRLMHQWMRGMTRREHDECQRRELEAVREGQKAGRIRSDLPAERLQEFLDAVSFSVVERLVFSGKRESVEEQIRVLWGLMSGGLGVGRSGDGQD